MWCNARVEFALGIIHQYRPMMPRTLKRGLALRWVLIQNKHWFDKMLSALFHTKSLMRHVLTLKDAMYNSYIMYAKKMRLCLR